MIRSAGHELADHSADDRGAPEARHRPATRSRFAGGGVRYMRADVVDPWHARSLSAPLTAILNLRGRKANSGWMVDHWRMISHHGGRDLDLGRDAGEWSVVVLRMQLPLVWMACICTVPVGQDVGHAQASGQLYWMFGGGEVGISAVMRSAMREHAQMARKQQAVHGMATRSIGACFLGTGRSLAGADGTPRRRVRRINSARSGRGTAQRAGQRSSGRNGKLIHASIVGQAAAYRYKENKQTPCLGYFDVLTVVLVAACTTLAVAGARGWPRTIA